MANLFSASYFYYGFYFTGKGLFCCGKTLGVGGA